MIHHLWINFKQENLHIIIRDEFWPLVTLSVLLWFIVLYLLYCNSFCSFIYCIYCKHCLTCFPRKTLSNFAIINLYLCAERRSNKWFALVPRESLNTTTNQNRLRKVCKKSTLYQENEIFHLIASLFENDILIAISEKKLNLWIGRKQLSSGSSDFGIIP